MKDKLYKMMDWPEIEAIVYGEEAHPERILGRHTVSTSTLFQTFMPDAKEVILVIEDEKNGDKTKEVIMELADEEGFYAASVLGKIKGRYHYIVTDIKGKKKTVEDPYDFNPAPDKKDSARFIAGESLNAYEFMGSHVTSINGTKGVVFRVWAPNAIRVSLIGEFNNYNGVANPMIKDDATGIYSLFVPGLAEDTAYKYEISAKGGKTFIKNDPYAVKTIKGSVVVAGECEYSFKDEAYLKQASKADRSNMPLSIYQTEIISLLDAKGKLTDKKLKTEVNRAKKCGYDYVELITNSDNSYLLPAGLTADDIKKLVDSYHAENVGVIFEWNPGSFAVGEEGMSCFDGTYLYGHLDERKRYNLASGGYNYNYSRPEVISYLNSNATYWLKEFHFDGIFVEGLSSMLYLDYGKYDREWVANIYGGHENLETIDFIKKFNTMLHKEYPYAISLTREEGAFPKVTDKPSEDGLGFDYIWNNGVSEDYLDFMKGDNAFTNVNKLTDNMSYAYCENYMLTISKEDVIVANEYDHIRVENGAGYFDYIPVEDEKKDAVKRATLAYLMAHQGKKLIYKGQDNEAEIAELNALYKKLPALHKLDRSPYGFEWINAINTGDGVIAFLRKDEFIDHSILVVCNFSDKEYKEYKLGLPYEGKYKMIFTSDDKKYGGTGSVNNRFKNSTEEFYNGRPNSLKLKLAPRSVTYYSYTPYSEEELLEIAKEKVERFKKQLEDAAREKAKLLIEQSSK